MLKRYNQALAFLGALLCTGPSFSGELGNINFKDPETEQEAREANATALEGFSDLFSALASRETLESDGKEEFSAAAERFRSASEQMFDIAEDKSFPEVSLDDFQDLLDASGVRPEVALEIRTLRDAYIVYASRIEDAADALDDLSNVPAEERIFDNIHANLDTILSLGNAIAEISASTS